MTAATANGDTLIRMDGVSQMFTTDADRSVHLPGGRIVDGPADQSMGNA